MGTDDLVSFPTFTDMKIGDMLSVTMPVAYWLGLMTWACELDSMPTEMRAVRSLVLGQILTPLEIKEQLAHDQAHRDNPLLGTPLEGLAKMFRPPWDSPDGGDPREGT